MINGEPIVLGGKGETASIFVTGLQSTDTVTASKDGKSWNGNWIQKINPIWQDLPSGYTQVEYIESNGSQRIDTGVTVSSDLTVTMKYKVNSFNGGCLFGARTTATSNAFLISAVSDSSQPFFLNYGSAYTTSGTFDTDSIYTVSMEKNVVKVDGVTIHTFTASTFSTNLNIQLFATNDNGTYQAYGSGRTYYCEMKNDSTLVRQYVPCKNSSNVYGLYDKVNNTFNSGTGTFTGGAEVPQYIYGHLISKLNSYGQYSVVATDGTHTATESVLVDMATEYTIPMLFILYLYNEGDECESVTGGWLKRYRENGIDGSWSNSNNVLTVIGSNMASAGECGAGATNLISFTGYSKLCMRVVAKTSSTYYANIFGALIIHTYQNAQVSESSIISISHTPNEDVPLIVETNITSLTSGYVSIMGYAGSGRISIDKLWLE